MCDVMARPRPAGARAVIAAAGQAQPKPGFDCAKAGSAVDRLICSDDGLAKLDRALAEQYEELHRTLTPEGFAVLRSGQRNWLASRSRCVAKDVTHDQGVQCLSEHYTDRANDLNAQYKTAGGLSIESRETSRHLPRLRVNEAGSYPLACRPTGAGRKHSTAISLSGSAWRKGCSLRRA